MDALSHLLQQTRHTHSWTHKLIDDIPIDKWHIIPNNMQSNITWQVGHLVVSHYYHAIWAIQGHQMNILQSIPLQQYAQLFTANPPKEAVNQIDIPQLLADLHTMEQTSLNIIAQLTEQALTAPLEPITPTHPIAHNKLEAIDWNIHHTMWHCGQIAMIRRSVYRKMEFGLQL
ncbi:DinB family protein [Chitinophaga skermanii]|nr:DinB family protein [Chitinophaga skermanii]